MDALTPYLLVLAIPVGLLILYTLFRWRYTVAIRQTILSPFDAAGGTCCGHHPQR